MKQFLIGKIQGKPSVVFYDIKDFVCFDKRNEEIISFTEDDIDYSYIKENGQYKEITNAAPEFDEYELTTDEAKIQEISNTFKQIDLAAFAKLFNDVKSAKLSPDGNIIVIEFKDNSGIALGKQVLSDYIKKGIIPQQGEGLKDYLDRADKESKL